MIDNRLQDNNGDTVTSYHQRHFSHFTGFPQYHNTNIDKVCQFLDHGTFQSFLDFQEQDRAYDIDYAHGLELDDEFGDPYGIPRNNLDDTAYRFILKCHILAIKCNGTLPELIQFISAVLGCSEDDVTLDMARHYVNGQLTGEPDTILIRNINIDNVLNDQLVPLLANQLQLAVPANKRVLDVNFDTSVNTDVYIGIIPVATAGATLNITIPASVSYTESIDVTDHIGVEPAAGLIMPISFPKNITDYETLPTATAHIGAGLNIHAHATIPMPLSNEQVNVNVPITDGIKFVGYGYAEI